MITILYRGEGSLRTPKSDYVICARPLIMITILMRKSMIIKHSNTWKSEASDKKSEHHHVGEDCGKIRNLVTIKVARIGRRRMSRVQRIRMRRIRRRRMKRRRRMTVDFNEYFEKYFCINTK